LNVTHSRSQAVKSPVELFVNNFEEIFKLNEFKTSVKMGDVEAVQIMLSDGVDANFLLSSKSSPLNIAAEKGDIAMIRLLLQSNFNPNKLDSSGHTSLAHAIENDSLKVVEEFLLYKGIKITYRELIQAVKKEKFFSRLLDATTDTKTGKASCLVDLSVAQLAKIFRDASLGMMKLAVKKGANLEQKDDAGESLLHYIIAEGENDRAKLEYLVNLLGKTSPTHVHQAVNYDNPIALELLLDAGALTRESVLTKDINGDSLLHCIIKNTVGLVPDRQNIKLHELFRYLTELGANMNEKDQQGFIPFHYMVNHTAND
jgi:ankyrin repeat protein